MTCSWGRARAREKRHGDGGESFEVRFGVRQAARKGRRRRCAVLPQTSPCFRPRSTPFPAHAPSPALPTCSPSSPAAHRWHWPAIARSPGRPAACVRRRGRGHQGTGSTTQQTDRQTDIQGLVLRLDKLHPYVGTAGRCRQSCTRRIKTGSARAGAPRDPQTMTL
jgi:hypothetical protein